MVGQAKKLHTGSVGSAGDEYVSFTFFRCAIACVIKLNILVIIFCRQCFEEKAFYLYYICVW